MSAVEASREFKAVIRGDGDLTAAVLAAAVVKMEGHLDVPPNARLDIVTSARGGGHWSIVARWDPAEDDRPTATPEEFKPAPGWGVEIIPGTDPEAIARNIQRRIRDNPQA